MKYLFPISIILLIISVIFWITAKGKVTQADAAQRKIDSLLYKIETRERNEQRISKQIDTLKLQEVHIRHEYNNTIEKIMLGSDSFQRVFVEYLLAKHRHLDSLKDSLSKAKEINLYLAKGAEARELLIIYKKIHRLDSQLISSKDSTIVDLRSVNTLKDKQIELYIKKYNNQRALRRAFEALALAAVAAYIYKK